MSITISGISIAPQQGVQNASASVQDAISALVGTAPAQDTTSASAVSQASQLQSQNSGLKQAATNLAQGSSLAQVASDGTSQIASLVQQLTILAGEAQSPSLSDSDRASLNQQFQDLAAQIDQVAGSTSFGGQALLDGSLFGSSALSLSSLISGTASGTDSGSLSIPDLQTSSLFGGQTPDVSTADSAQQAEAALAAAFNTVSSAQSDIGSFQQGADFASASVDTALANQEAAQSTLSDSDFAAAATQLSAASLQQNAATAIAAQTGQLTPDILQLLGA